MHIKLQSEVFWEEATLLIYDLGVDGRITLNIVFKKQVVGMWTFLAHGAVHWTTRVNAEVQQSLSPHQPQIKAWNKLPS